MGCRQQLLCSVLDTKAWIGLKFIDYAVVCIDELCKERLARLSFEESMLIHVC